MKGVGAVECATQLVSECRRVDLCHVLLNLHPRARCDLYAACSLATCHSLLHASPRHMTCHAPPQR